jgi:uncharacterized protein YceH (UPF0502 family)
MGQGKPDFFELLTIQRVVHPHTFSRFFHQLANAKILDLEQSNNLQSRRISENLQWRIAELESEVRMLRQQLDELTKPKKRGRKPKNQ